MTKAEFKNIKVGDIINDYYNGFNRVYSVDDGMFSCDYVEFEVDKNDWVVRGLSWDVTEEEATTKDDLGNERWQVMTDEEIAKYIAEMREDWGV